MIENRIVVNVDGKTSPAKVAEALRIAGIACKVSGFIYENSHVQYLLEVCPPTPKPAEYFTKHL